MKVFEIKLSELNPAEYNPRAMSKKEVSDLKASIDKFGMVEPIVVNSAENRKNIIIGGHQRYFLLKENGDETIPVVYVDIPDLKKEQELNLRLNKNLGHWSWDMLANFDEELLKKSGFGSEELEIGFGLNDLENRVEGEEIDFERLDVIGIDGPNAPRLKVRSVFYFEDINDLKKIKEYFRLGNKENVLDSNKLIELIDKN